MECESPMFLSELGTCLQNLISVRKKEIIFHWAMLKFTYKGRFLTIKRHIKNCCIENPNDEHMYWCLLYLRIFIKKNWLKIFQISIFSGVSKFLELIVFGQILAILGRFWQFWAHIAAMAMTNSMPSFERKKNKTS
jgi:hypothetical protein